jgi:diadenosine tetraphosphate (Ap4A) HIT family hydrolase
VEGGSEVVSEPCPFCDDTPEVVAENELAIAFRDVFPVSPGHTLIIPRRHEPDFTRLSAEEQSAVMELAMNVVAALRKELSPDGFNIGVNVAAAGGQTIAHAHLHIIPRYAGDVADPRGGIRWALPDKAPYWNVGNW